MKITDLEGKTGRVHLVFPVDAAPRVTDLKTGEVTRFFITKRVFVSVTLSGGIYAEDIPLDVSEGVPYVGEEIFLGEFVGSVGFRWRKA